MIVWLAFVIYFIDILMILFELLSSLKLTLSPIQNRGKFEAAQLFKTDICSEDLVTVVICQNIRYNFK